MKIKISALIIGLLLCNTAVACAKPGISVRAYTDRNTITIGDRIKYTLEITASRGTEIQMPLFKGGVIGDFEIKDFSSRMAKHLFGRNTLHNVYYITAYSTGKKEIPPVEVKYKLKGAKDWGLEISKAMPISIQSVLPKDLPLDIKGVRAPAYFFEINWIVVGALGIIVAFLIIALVVFKKIKDRKPSRLPHETAFEELEAIRAQFLRQGDNKEYFVGISDCIRRYIERVFTLKAPEMTSEEFLRSLNDSAALTIPQKDLLRGFMNACDLVKFARYSPTSVETENVYTTAKGFVEETKEMK